MRNLIHIIAVAGIWLTLVLGCTNSSRLTNNQSSGRNATVSSQNTSTPQRNLWGYSESDDETGRGRVYHTSILSTNTISLDSPYQGAQHGILQIREHPQYGRDVYLTIEKGQLLDSEFHGKVVVRFDSDKPLAFPSVRPADLSSETLFLRGNAFAVFINRLKTAKTVRIEVPVYHAGDQLFLFDVEGFTWKNGK